MFDRSLYHFLGSLSLDWKAEHVQVEEKVINEK